MGTTTALTNAEAALLEVGGNIDPPDPENASPEALCGRSSSKAQACLRTIPPREHGGNMDIRYLAAGSTIYLPCNIDGCGLGIGDTHYAQGDGEVSVTAIEMDARVTVRTAIVKDKVLRRGPHFAGPARLLDIPSRAFYATTGFPIKAEGFVPPWMRYLNADERIATGIYKHLLMAVSSVSPPKLSVGFPRFCRHHLSKSALCRHHQIHWSYYLHMFPKVVSRR